MRRLPCRPMQICNRRAMRMPRHGRQLIMAAASEGGGGWLSQWLQGFRPGQKGKNGTKGSVKQQAAEQAPKPGACAAGVDNITDHSAIVPIMLVFPGVAIVASRMLLCY